MNGNIKNPISAKQAQKIANISTFIEEQLEKLIDKLDDAEMHQESHEIEYILEQYSKFNESITEKLKNSIRS
jgi:hypothetical protein